MAEQATSLKVFVSYSRADVAFADQLVLALEDKGFAAILDRHDISGAENWRERLGKLILSADAVAFVLTGKSAASEICGWEVAEAVRLGKRIIPLTPEALQGAEPPKALGELNWIPFYAEPAIPGSGFYYGVKRLVEALSVDLDWLRAQTRYSERALEWAKERKEDLLLRGEALKEAEAWVARTPAGAHPPEVVREYLAASGDAEQHRQAAAKAQLQEREEALKVAEVAVADSKLAQARLRRFSVWALVAGVVLLAIAIPGNYFAATRTLDANDRRAAMFADVANDLSRQGDYSRALLIALAGDPPARIGLLEGLMRPDGNMSVRKALVRAYASDRTVAVVDAGMQNPQQLVALPDGKRFLTLSVEFAEPGEDATAPVGATGVLWLWTADAKAQMQKIALPHPAEEVYPLADDDLVLVRWGAFAPKAFSVWSLKEGRVVRDVGPIIAQGEEANVQAGVGFNRETLAVAAGSTLTIWDIADGELLAQQQLPDSLGGTVRAIVASEEEERVTLSLSTGHVIVWDVGAGELLEPVESVFGDIDALMYIDSSSIIFGSDTTQLGDVDEKGIMTSGLQAFTELSEEQGVATLRVAGERGIIVVSTGGRMRLLDVASEGWVEPFGRRSDIVDVDYLPKAGMFAALTQNGRVLLTAFGPTVAPVQISTLIGDAAEGETYGLIREFAASMSGAMAIETEDRRLVVWNPGTNTVDTYPAPSDVDRLAANLAVSSDGGTVFRSVGHQVEVWKRGSTTPIVHTVAPETDTIMRLQAIGDGRAFLFTTFAKNAGVMQADTGEAIIAPVVTEFGLAVANPDGQSMMQIQEDGTVGVIRVGEASWQVFREHGEVTSKTREADTRASTVVFSPDGATLAIGLRNGAVEMWRRDEKRAYRSMKGHSGPIVHIAFQPDGNLFATVGTDGRLQVWDLGESEPVQSFELGDYSARALAIPPGGREVLVVEEEGLFRFPISPIVSAGVDDQIRMACARLQERGVTGFSDRDYVEYTFLEKAPASPCKALGVTP
jgi:WD40 repeat protein